MAGFGYTVLGFGSGGHTQTKIQVEPEAAEVQADLVVEHQDNQAQVQV
jgi:hypothetical protein